MPESWSKQCNDGMRILRKVFDKKVKIDIPKVMRAGGNIALAISKEKGEYQDQTGNLRNSGHINYEHRDLMIPSSDKRVSMLAGMREPKLFIRNELISLFVGYGMEYAASVEDKGYDVLTGTMLIMEERFTKDLKGILKVKGHEIRF